MRRPGVKPIIYQVLGSVGLLTTHLATGWLQSAAFIFTCVAFGAITGLWIVDRKMVAYYQQRNEAQFQATLKRVFDRGGRYN